MQGWPGKGGVWCKVAVTALGGGTEGEKGYPMPPAEPPASEVLGEAGLLRGCVCEQHHLPSLGLPFSCRGTWDIE